MLEFLLRKGRPVVFDLPAIETAADVANALGAIAGAMAAGELTPDEAGAVAGVDLRDGILTLPAALAIRDPMIASMYCNPHHQDLAALAQALQTQIPGAEAYLDEIADEAMMEAKLFARNPDQLIALINHTRRLSAR